MNHITCEEDIAACVTILKGCLITARPEVVEARVKQILDDWTRHHNECNCDLPLYFDAMFRISKHFKQMLEETQT